MHLIPMIIIANREPENKINLWENFLAKIGLHATIMCFAIVHGDVE